MEAPHCARETDLEGLGGLPFAVPHEGDDERPLHGARREAERLAEDRKSIFERAVPDNVDTRMVTVRPDGADSRTVTLIERFASVSATRALPTERDGVASSVEDRHDRSHDARRRECVVSRALSDLEHEAFVRLIAPIAVDRHVQEVRRGTRDDLLRVRQHHIVHAARRTRG